MEAENGRAFGIVITRDIGSMSAAIIRDELVVTVFGACTPIPVQN